MVIYEYEMNESYRDWRDKRDYKISIKYRKKGCN